MDERTEKGGAGRRWIAGRLVFQEGQEKAYPSPGRKGCGEGRRDREEGPRDGGGKEPGASGGRLVRRGTVREENHGPCESNAQVMSAMGRAGLPLKEEKKKRGMSRARMLGKKMGRETRACRREGKRAWPVLRRKEGRPNLLEAMSEMGRNWRLRDTKSSRSSVRRHTSEVRKGFPGCYEETMCLLGHMW